MALKYEEGMIHYILIGLFFFHSLNGDSLWKHYPVDFYEAMKHSKLFPESSARKNRGWQMLEKLYTVAMHADYKTGEQLRIPNVFHLIWLGSSVPSEYLTLANKLRELHPGCQVRLWTDADARSFPMINRTAFNAAANYGEKSDIFRYEILYGLGGVYLDGDFILLKPLTDFLRACHFFAGIAYSESIEIYNGLIGCTAKHPIIKRCIQDLGTSGSKYDVNAILERTGPFHFTRCFLKEAKTGTGITVAFPTPFFYPWPSYDRHTRDNAKIRRWIRPYSVAVHLWASTWVK